MPAAGWVPPALPPSVEEAYRRKCIQLKQRTNEVEEANDAARIRLMRLKRQVEKMRLERAFLLEQLAKRTSTNVEDSDGSPSPPPTPKEKPLRIKRGHRKPSLLANIDAPTSAAPSIAAGAGGNATFISQNLQTAMSPSSDAFSSHAHGAGPSGPSGKANGVGSGLLRHKKPTQPTKPATAYELFCAESRADLEEKLKNDKEDYDLGEELELAWKDLSDEQMKEFEERAEQGVQKYRRAKEEYEAASEKYKEEREREEDDGNKTEDGAPPPKKRSRSGVSAEDTPRADEDVEMTNYDTDQETQGEKPDD